MEGKMSKAIRFLPSNIEIVNLNEEISARELSWINIILEWDKVFPNVITKRD